MKWLIKPAASVFRVEEFFLMHTTVRFIMEFFLMHKSVRFIMVFFLMHTSVRFIMVFFLMHTSVRFIMEFFLMHTTVRFIMEFFLMHTTVRFIMELPCKCIAFMHSLRWTRCTLGKRAEIDVVSAAIYTSYSFWLNSHSWNTPASARISERHSCSLSVPSAPSRGVRTIKVEGNWLFSRNTSKIKERKLRCRLEGPLNYSDFNCDSSRYR